MVEIVGRDVSAEQLAVRWPPLALARFEKPKGPVELRLVAEGDAVGDEIEVTVDGEPSSGGWDRLESDLALFASERIAGLVAIHAAVIIRGAEALLVPGTSHAGKSTLCLAAAGVGARVLTDEYALVDPITGRVAGWRRPVRARRPDGAIDRLDIAVASDPVAVGLVALVAYDADPAHLWAPISGAEAVMGLLANTVCAQSRPDEALDAALALARSSQAVAGSRGEAIQAIVELLALIDGRAGSAGTG